MSTGFAGSRTMDERRRRRLASESSESLEDSNEDAVSQNIARTHRFASGQYPLRTIVFPRRWKLAAYYLPVLFCFAALVTADLYRPELTKPDSALAGYLSLKTSSLSPVLSGALLFVSGQLSLLIASLRTQSLHDFSGRYRLWKWVACGLFLFALCTTTSLHQIWASTVIELRLFDWGPHTHLLAWMVPALVLGSSVALMTYLELRGDRAGLNMTIIAVASYVGYLTFQFTDNLIPGTAYHHLIGSGLLLFAHWCFFTSLLLHLHHLLYQSVDLPEKVPSRFKKIGGEYLRRRRIKRKAKRVAKALLRKKQREATRLEQEAAEQARLAEESIEKQNSTTTPEKSKEIKPAPTPKEVTSVSEKPKAPEPAQAEKQPPAAKTVSRQKNRPAQKKSRVDQPHDPEQLKGLSKRERRKLQKQWREAERQNAAEDESDWS
ncbi:hypothetical protein [Gimesia algae]|uniref:Uncharacterized protein n=1 Tax=Gimesia algae TaxID=2527971 RepID=A0A517VFY8_9PLAN|nr:hypothetical protein [Gimesia algae]QDT91936.1 hypothetical protein Pan161_36000 [Gimesia algae]